jgi:hypothetical protein
MIRPGAGLFLFTAGSILQQPAIRIWELQFNFTTYLNYRQCSLQCAFSNALKDTAVDGMGPNSSKYSAIFHVYPSLRENIIEFLWVFQFISIACLLVFFCGVRGQCVYITIMITEKKCTSGQLWIFDLILFYHSSFHIFITFLLDLSSHIFSLVTLPSHHMMV